MRRTFGDFLCAPGFAGPRGVSALAREGSTVIEGARFACRASSETWQRCALRPGHGRRREGVEPVVLVPGFMAGDYTLAGMATLLRNAGFRTYGAGIVANVGCARQAGDRLEDRVQEIVERRASKVTVVGHSLGGMLARALAAKRPDLVHGVVTMGSPVLAPAAVHPLLAFDTALLTRLHRVGIGGLMSRDCVQGDCARVAFEEVGEALPQGFEFTAIYSQRDGIVDWRACLDPRARQIEVRTSHCGMVVDPVVVDHVIEALRHASLRRANRPATRRGQGRALHAVRR